MDWINANWQPGLLIAAGILAALLTAWVVVLALIYIYRGLRRLADVQLELARVRRNQAILQAEAQGDQTVVLRKELRDCEARLKEALNLALARERLLAAQDENLAGRAKALAAAERDLAAIQRRHDDERSRHLATEERVKQLAGQLAAVQEQAAQSEQAASMMERQMHAMQQNAAMLSTTVADLNAKRDLLVQENGHLRERLDQESASRRL
jgi:hypothetical protein